MRTKDEPLLSGGQIAAARGLVGWDRAELALRAGVTKQSVWRWEAGLTHLSDVTVARRVVESFSVAGAVFIGLSPDAAGALNLQPLEAADGPGVRLRQR